MFTLPVFCHKIINKCSTSIEVLYTSFLKKHAVDLSK